MVHRHYLSADDDDDTYKSGQSSMYCAWQAQKPMLSAIIAEHSCIHVFNIQFQ